MWAFKDKTFKGGESRERQVRPPMPTAPGPRSLPGAAGARIGSRYLAEEGEDALVLFQELGNGEAAALDAPQRVEEQVPVEGTLPLLRPHVDLLLMVGEGAVIPVFTVLLVNHVCKEATGHAFRQVGTTAHSAPAP